MKENESKRQHWGESVKGRVSSDYKAHVCSFASGEAVSCHLLMSTDCNMAESSIKACHFMS